MTKCCNYQLMAETQRHRAWNFTPISPLSRGISFVALFCPLHARCVSGPATEKWNPNNKHVFDHVRWLALNCCSHFDIAFRLMTCQMRFRPGAYREIGRPIRQMNPTQHPPPSLSVKSESQESYHCHHFINQPSRSQKINFASSGETYWCYLSSSI